MESNIWACIYRALNKKRDIAYEGDFDLTYDSDSDEGDYKDTIEEYKESIGDILKKEMKPRRSVNVDGHQTSDGTSFRVTDDAMDLNFHQNIRMFGTESHHSSSSPSDEEDLVVYYSLNLIKLEKYRDSIRVIIEYMNKKIISPTCKANCLYLLSISTIFEDLKISKQCVMTALKS